MMTQNGERYVSIDEAARILKDELEENGWKGGANTIKSWMYRKLITPYRRGRYQVIDLEELRQFIRENGRKGDIRPWRSDE